MNSDTTTKKTPREIQRLVELVKSMPTTQQTLLKPALDEVVSAASRRQRLTQMIQEALGQLRLDIKYLEFDLQATRVERDDYKIALDRYEEI